MPEGAWISGALEFVASTGAEGVELISDQMITGAPKPTDETVGAWRRALDESGLVPVCNDIFINSTIYRNRTLRTAEQAELLKLELEVTKRLGFSLARLVSDTSPDVTEAVLPFAESIGVTMALEIHAGMSFGGAVTTRWIEMMERAQSERLGLVIDFGIFCDRIPRVATHYFETLGLTPAVAEELGHLYATAGDTMRVFGNGFSGGRIEFPEDLSALFAGPVDAEYAFFTTGYENTPLDVLDRYFPYVKHSHGKIYEMTVAGEEYSIDYPTLVAHLDELGYSGYISTEYEGNRFVPVDEPVFDREQIRAHQELLGALIGK